MKEFMFEDVDRELVLAALTATVPAMYKGRVRDDGIVLQKRVSTLTPVLRGEFVRVAGRTELHCRAAVPFSGAIWVSAALFAVGVGHVLASIGMSFPVVLGAVAAFLAASFGGRVALERDAQDLCNEIIARLRSAGIAGAARTSWSSDDS